MRRSQWLLALFAALLVGIAIGSGGAVVYLRYHASVKPEQKTADEPTTTSDVVNNFDPKDFLDNVPGPLKKPDTKVYFQSVGGSVGSRHDREIIAFWYCDPQQRPIGGQPPVFDRLSQEVERRIKDNGGVITSRLDDKFPYKNDVSAFERTYRVDKDDHPRYGVVKVWCVAGHAAKDASLGVIFTLIMQIKETSSSKVG
jgi:hypothetical protein